MAPTYQRKEDFDKKSQAWIAAASRAWGIPEDELWQEIFDDAKHIDELFPSPNNPETNEFLVSFPVPKNQ
jgi:hypothetical protein